ncbi:alpha/beta hydrolase [Bacillus sp. JJ1764]|uniref:alpha/beta hydrolase n=1 Tax=Bacillus sp. JJ1764 TaxID=3122964 RepID=UPI002FFDCCDC
MNIHYGKHTKQTLDIYRANTEKKSPVIIYVHGGSWTAGDKNNVSKKPLFFTNQGFVFVSVNYRLFPEASYHQMTDDLSSAIKWIYDHADHYEIDKTRINLMGHSAGGHLVTLIGTNPKYLNKVGLSPLSVRSIIDLEGPVDLSLLVSRDAKFKRVFGDNKMDWAEASPLAYAKNQYAPLFLVNHRDSSIKTFLEVASSAGNTVKYFECRTLSHRGITKELGSTTTSEEAKDLTNAVVDFLKTYN